MTRSGFQTFERITHRAAIVGRVTDRLAQTPLEGVEVLITSGPAAWTARVAWLRQGRPSARPELRTTDADGFFHWLDLPAGAYVLGASVPGTLYTVASENATVGAAAPATVELALAPTTITGVVQTGIPTTPIGLARVRLVDSGEATYTRSDGSFTLSPVEAGTNRTLEISGPNYITATQRVTLPQGQTTTVPSISMTHR